MPPEASGRARRFDPRDQQWGALERLTGDPLPDINPRLWGDGQGRAALVWQGFRGWNSSIFLRRFDGARWLPTVRVTRHAANDWEPAVAVDTAGTTSVAYDSYLTGRYDVRLAQVRGDNILLDVRMGDALMGDQVRLPEPAPLRIRARGTRAIARLDVIRDSAAIYSAEPR